MWSGVEQPGRTLVHPKPKALPRMPGVGRALTALVGPSSTSTAKRGRILHRRCTGRELVGHVGHIANAIAGRWWRVDAGEG